MKIYRNLTLFMSIEKKRNSSIKRFYFKKEKKQFYEEVKKLKKYYLYVVVTPLLKFYQDVTIRGGVTVAGGSEEKKNYGGGPGQPSIFFIHSFKAPLPREFKIPILSEHNQLIYFFNRHMLEIRIVRLLSKKTTVSVRERFYRNKLIIEKSFPAD